MIRLLDEKVQPELRQGRYPERGSAKLAAEVVRAIARDLDKLRLVRARTGSARCDHSDRSFPRSRPADLRVLLVMGKEHRGGIRRGQTALGVSDREGRTPGWGR